jgi:adhesin/invasin
MKSIVRALLLVLVLASLAGAQVPGYSLVVRNDSVASPTAYDFDIYIMRADPVTFELASFQGVLTFNTGISSGVLSISLRPGTSQLLAAQQPSSMSVSGDEIQIDPAALPGAGSGTDIPTLPGVRIGRFRLSSSVPWNNASANLAWKNSPDPATAVRAYIDGTDSAVTDNSGHLTDLVNAPLLPPTKLAFTQQPTSVIAGAAISPAVAVQVQNAFGGAFAAPGVAVTIALASGSGHLSGTLTSLTDANGVATFSDLSVDTAGAKTLSASAASLTSATSSSFTVSAGPAAVIVVVQQPSNAVAGVSISPSITVQVQDGFGNNVPGGGVSVVMSLSSGTGALTGTLSRSTTGGGLATFSDLKIDLAGSKQLTASATANGLGTVTTNSFTISPAAANKLAFVQPPSGATAGVAISPAVTVQLQDAFGNSVATSGTNVTMALASGTGTLAGTTTQPTNGSGVATFANLSIAAAGAKTLTASSTGLTSTTSGSFAITAAAASKVVYIQQPTNRAAGAAITPAVTVQVEDQFNNAVAGAGVSVTIALTTGTGTLGGTLTQATNASGLATFGDLSVDLAGSKNLTASSSGLSSAVSSAFTIAAAAVNKVAFIQEPTGATAGAAISPAVTVQLQDTFGNNVSTSGTSVVMSIASGTGTLSGTATQSTNASGLATFANLSINLIGAKTLRAASTGLVPDTSASFAISAGAATRVAFTQQPTSATAGALLSPAVSVQLQDASGNPVTTSGVFVTLALTTGTGSLAGTLTTTTDGTGTASFADLSVATSGVKGITASSSGLTSAVSSSFTISPAAASQLAFIQQPTNATAGAGISPSVTVQLRDQFGNNVPSSGVSVAMSLTSGTGTLSGTASQSTNGSGLATFAGLSINLAGSKNLTASSSGLTPAVSSAFTIAAAAVNKLAFLQEPTGTSAGAAISPAVTVQLQDVFGNSVSTSGTTVTMTLASGTGGLSGTTSQSTNASGLATFANLSINLIGAKTLRAASTGLVPDTSASFTIGSGAATRLAFTQQPSSATAGAAIAPAIAVQLQDGLGNPVATGGTGVTLSLTTGTGTLAGTLTVNTDTTGTATFDDISVAVTGVKGITASSTGLTSAVSTSFTISPGAASQLAFVQQPTSATAGVSITPSVTVQLRDQFGNNVPSSGVTVTMSLSTGTGTLSGTASQATNGSGLATFAGLSINLAGSKNLTAASGALTAAVSSAFTISAAAASALTFTVQPSGAVAGDTITPAVTVQLRDAFGNPVASSGVSVTLVLASGAGTLSGAAPQPTNGSGVATFSSLSVNLVGSKTLGASASGLAGATSDPFVISPDAASQLAFVQQPTAAAATATITPAVTVQLLDRFGNSVPSAGVTVSVALSGGTGTLSGTLARSTSGAGLATFNDLSINLTGSKTISASSAGLTGATSGAFTISAGAAKKLAFGVQPSDLTAGATITPAVTVQLQDSVGNAVPSAGVAISVALSSGTGTLGGTLTRSTDAAGLATFNDLSLTSAGAKAITASSAGVTSIASASFTVSAAAASQVTFVQEPTSAVAGTAIAPAVTARLRDQFNNAVSSAGVAVTVSIASGTGALSGTATQSTNGSGIATFANLSINLAGSKTLRAVATGLVSDTSASFTISPAAASQLSFLQQPTGTVATAAISPAVTVQLLDQFGNAVPASGTAVAIALSSGTGTLSGTLSRSTNASGIATFNDLSIELTGTKALTASATGLGTVQSASFAILAGAATKVVFVQQPTAVTAGVAVSPAVSVQLEDASGNPVPSSGVTITLSLSSGTGVLSGTLSRPTDAGGLASFNDLSVNLAGSKALTAASSGVTSAVSSSFTVTAAAASQLAFVQQPTNEVAGVAISPTITVQLRDQFGNNVSSSGVGVTMAISSGNGTLSGTTTQATNAGGLASFANLSIDLAGSKILTATSGALTAAVSSSFTISAATLARVAFTQEIATATAGAAITPALTVQLQDTFGNAIAASGTSVTVSLVSGTGTLSGTTTQSTNASGVATFANLSINLAGSKALRAAATGLAPDTTAAFAVIPAAATALLLTQQPTSATAGAAITPAVTVQLRDQFGNNVLSSGVSVTMALSSGSGTLSGTLTQPTNGSGVATFGDLSVNLSGTKALTASSAGLTSGVSTSFTIFAGTAAALAFVQEPSSALPNVAITPAVTVQIRDNFGNNVSAQSVSISMALTSGTGSLSGTTTRTTNASGLASFNDLSINLVGTKALTASSAGLTSDTSASFGISAGAATTVRVETAADGTGTTVPAQNLASGTSLTVYAISRDAAGNFVANVAATAWSLVSATGGVVAGDLVPSGDSKSAVLTGHVTGTAQIRATSGALTPVNSGTITVIAGVPTQLVFSQQPSNGVAGAFIAPAVTVQLRDASGNNAPVAGTSVTMALSSGTGSLTGTTTQPTNGSGVATFANLSVNQPGTKALTASSAGLTGAVSASFSMTTYTITASAGANGSISPSGAVSVVHGADQLFTMTPNLGYVVSSILVDGVGAGSASTYLFDSVTTNHTISVSFAPATLSMTVTTSPAGKPITVDGIAYTSPQSFTWTANTTHTIAIDSLQPPAAGKRLAFTSWSDGGASSHTVTPLVNTTYTAALRSQFLLTMSANTGGTVAPATSYQDTAALVQISATASSGYSFSSWTGSGPGAVIGGVNPGTVFMGGPISEIANFALNNVLITVNTSPPGRQFYVDGASYSVATTFSFLPGSIHTLSADSIQSATSTARFAWGSWSDGDVRTHSITIPFGNATYTANFKRQFFVTMNAGIGGTVAPPSAWHDSASVFSVSAAPGVGYSFTGWTGSGPGSYSGPLNPANVTTNGPVTETAGFTLFPVDVTIATVPAGRTYTVDGVPFTGTQTFIWSATAPHTISTTSPQGDTLTRYLWSGWSDGGGQSHTVAPITDTTFTVSFATQHYLSMKAGTGGTVAPASGWFPVGQLVGIAATAGTGYTFSSWSGTGTGSYTGAVNNSTVTMNGPVTETANFTPNSIQVTVATSPVGRTIIVDGSTFTAPQTFTWTANTAHTIATDTTQPGAAGSRFVWSSWNDAGALSHTVSPLVNTTYTATFGTQYSLTMNAGTGGTVSPPTGWFASGAAVPITATPGTGYGFSAWTGSGSGSYTGATNPSSVTMNGPITETAAFTPNSIQVTVATSPAGRTITVDGTAYTAPHTFTWLANSNHTLQADSILAGLAGTRYVYANWSDAGAMTHVVAPLVNTTYTANFTTQYFLTMNANVGGSALPASAWYTSGQTVSITAVPVSGYGFLNWNGGGVGSYSGGNNPANVVMNGPITETANFAQFPYQVTVGTNPPGRAYRVNGTDYTTPQTFSVQPGNGLTVAIISDPQPGATGTRYSWANWSDGGAMNHFFIPSSDSVLVATFTTQYFLTTSAGTGGTVAPASGWHDAASSVAVSATPGLGYSFSTWTGTGAGAYTGPNNPATVTMNGPVAEVASFTLFPVQVTFQSDPPGRTITVDGTTYDAPETFTFTSGTSHTISADSLQSGSPGTRYAWTGWSDAGARSHAVTVLSDTTFTVRLKTQFALTTIAATGGTVSAGGWLDSAQSASITATPSAGYGFGGWTGTGNGSYTGLTNPATVTMRGPVTDSASFTLGTVQVTVASSPVGRTIIVDGTTYTAPQTFSWQANSNHTIETDTIQTGTIGTRYVFASWSDSGGISHLIAPSATRTYTVTFGTQYYLTMNTNTGGSVTPPSGWFARNSAVTISAAADNGYGFLSWSGTGTGSYSGGNNPATVFMSAPITETANFGQNAVLVTIRTSPSGRTFIVDGTTYTSVFTFSYLPGSVHTISADTIQTVAGGTRYLWTAWSDTTPRTHTLEVGTRDSLITATFRTQYGLTTSSSPAGAGVITPAGVTYFNVGDTATVTAASNPGYAFTGWTGSITSSLNPVRVVMSAPKTATATFAPGARITVQSNPAGRTIIVDDSAYAAPQTFNWLLNSSHTIATTTPQQVAGSIRYLFTGWSDGGALSHSVTVTKDSVLTAAFTTQYYLFTSSGAGGSVTPGEAWHDAGETVTITATPDSGFGFIEWQGTGTGSYSGGSSTANIVMQGWIVETASFGALLPPPTLAGLADGSTGVVPTPTLAWRRYAGATAYLVQVSADSLFRTTSFDSATITDTTVRVGTLLNQTRYYWRVKAKVGQNITTFSSSRSFTTRPKVIAPATPASIWVTRYIQTLTWSSVDQATPVNILLTTNGGLTYTTLLASVPNLGTVSWRLPDATPTGTACRIRVSSAADAAVYGETGPFTIVSGQLPLIVPLSTTVAFPDDPSTPEYYRLISAPGIVDSTKRVTDYLPGTPPDDWRMFWDNGAAENYLEEMTPLSLFGTGRGYWLLKKRDFNFVSNMAMPPVDSMDGAFGISLHAGWNIIANPFDRNVAWSAVQDLNGLAPAATAYGYGGSFQAAAVLEPFKGYYFFNEESLAILRVPYPFGSPSLHAKAEPAGSWRVQLSLGSAENDDPENFVGVAPGSSEALDRADRRKPPLFMDQAYLYFDRPEWDRAYHRFNADIRPELGEGQSWEFTVSAKAGTKARIAITGLESVPPGYEVALVSAWNTTPVDVRSKPVYAFTSVAPVTPFTLLVGTREFIRAQAGENVPDAFALEQNFPNPFNPVTSISIRLPRASDVRLEVFSVLGQRVATLAEGPYEAGVHTFVWDGTDDRGLSVSSGVYLYRLMDGATLVQTKKMLLTK